MSRRTPRLYVPLDARFFDDDDIIRAGEKAAFLYLNILCAIKADQSDGTISLLKIQRLHVDNYKPRLQKLIATGLIIELESSEIDDVTYLVPAWSKWNLLSHELAEKSEIARQNAKRRWKGHANGNADGNASRIELAMLNKERNKERARTISTIGESVDNVIDNLIRREQEQ